MSRNHRPRWPVLLGSAFACATLAARAGYSASPPQGGAAPPGIWGGAHLEPGGQRPAGAVLHNPYNGNVEHAKAGASLFVAMHCDGCHGDDASGSVGPNLGDGRWIFGGSDGAVFDSIYYGRPNGMPAWGGVLGEKGVWDIVTYLRSLAPPPDLPTESWEPKPAATAAGKPSEGK